jgi:hypothetical protein
MYNSELVPRPKMPGKRVYMFERKFWILRIETQSSEHQHQKGNRVGKILKEVFLDSESECYVI